MFGIQLTVNYVHPLPIVPTSAVLWMPWKICWIGPLLGYQRNLREDKVMEEEATEEESSITRVGDAGSNSIVLVLEMEMTIL